MAITAGSLGLRFRSFLAFSRALQASLSVAQACFFALVAAHGFPSAERVVIGLVAAFAGYFAVFALNDLLDIDLDRARFAHLRGYDNFDIDSTLGRHPLAQGQITFALGLVWAGFLATLAVIAAYILNPLSALLFIIAASLEIVYCKLARVTPFKFVIIGLMMGIGPLAGWFAVTNEVRLWEIAIVFIWLFAWEIGGRNIVNDFADVDEDIRLGIRTVPVVYGPDFAARLTFAFLVITFIAALALQPFAGLSIFYLAAVTVAGIYLLIAPGIRLLRSPVPQNAMFLFNRASCYPPVMVAVLVLSIYLPF